MNFTISKILPVEPADALKSNSRVQAPAIEGSFNNSFSEYHPAPGLPDDTDDPLPQVDDAAQEIAFEDSFDGDARPQFPQIVQIYDAASGLPVEINPSAQGGQGEEYVPLNIAEVDPVDRDVRKPLANLNADDNGVSSDRKNNTDYMVKTDWITNIPESVSALVEDNQIAAKLASSLNSEPLPLVYVSLGNEPGNSQFLPKINDLESPETAEKPLPNKTVSELDLKLLQSAADKNRQKPEPAKIPEPFPVGNSTNQTDMATSEQTNIVIANIGTTNPVFSGIPTNSISSPQVLTAPLQTLDVSHDEKWIAQISSEIRKFSAPGDTLRFQMKPVHLGQLQIEIGGGQTGKNVHVKTENEESRALIAAVQSRLEQDLRLAGSRLGKVDVTVEPDGFPDSPSGEPASYEQRSSQSNKDRSQIRGPEVPQDIFHSTDFPQNQKQTERYA